MKRYYIFFVVMAIIAALAIGSNSLLRRGSVHDSAAVNDIQTIQSAVDNYFLKANRLPDNLNQIELNNPRISARLNDYEYTRKSAEAYELCATFQTEHHADYQAPISESGYAMPDPQNHQKGRQCFTYRQLPIQSDRPSLR